MKNVTRKQYLSSQFSLSNGLDGCDLYNCKYFRYYLPIKRFFDVLVSFLVFILLFPVYVFIAIIILRDSEGPIIYRGYRAGLFGQPFKIIKFRTMVPNAEQQGGLSTAQDDPRITDIGHLLRRYKLDELPQLINVFLGDMSIVGPRPEMLKYTSEYIGEERLILTVRPGITDYASIEFSKLGDILGNVDVDNVYEEKVKPIKNRLRLLYVKDMSFMVDIAIIINTLLKILNH
jgi:lipopolysaccharide/colanic/teichoic acid biosynthesis glycosyltransferase